jgi:hypothetical protein
MPINPTLIGTKVGAGLQHQVFEYGADQVIKIPRWWMRLSFRYEDKVQEFNLLKEYLADLIPETRLIPYKNSYCYLQKRISKGTILSLEPGQKTLPAFKILHDRNKQLITEAKRSMDFVGFQLYATLPRPMEHRQHRHINNVVVHPDAPHGIYLLDTDTLYTTLFAITKPSHVIFGILSFFMHLYNTLLLKIYRVHLDD